MITEPKVTLLASTVLAPGAYEILEPMMDEDTGNPIAVEEIDYLAEIAGRACYQSWDRPNSKTAATAAYVGNILDVKHYSVLAHGSCAFYIEGVSRSLTLEMIRSRFLGFSQLSQRYVDSKSMDWVVPPLLLSPEIPANGDVIRILDSQFDDAVIAYEEVVERLEEQMRIGGTLSGTLLRKRAREAARATLPNDTETKLVVSGNMRAWRDFIAQRWSVHADLEIMRLAGVLLAQLRDLAPATFADFGEEPAT